MTRKEALAELISEVEAGMWPGTNILHKIDDNYGFNAWRAYAGSLDAAKALHEAVLPGQDWSISPSKSYAGNGFKGESKDPARAWLLAILRALHAQEQPANETSTKAPIGGETGAEF